MESGDDKKVIIDRSVKKKSNKNVRHRKKNIYNEIRQQMEFYFGDANLSKDRFLMQLIKEDPFIPLEVFLNFNKLKKLITKTSDIAKSLTNSNLLELNEDQTKVRRKLEIPENRNADDRTIYVECLPRNANHDTVISAFSKFGPVAYVSLPRYRRSRKIKEFGFIEFEDLDSVEKVLKTFKSFDGLLCPDVTNPAELISVTSFIKEQKEETEEPHHTSEPEEVDQIETNKTKKRAKSPDSSSSESAPPLVKRVKTDTEENTGSEDIASLKGAADETKKKKRKKHKKKGSPKTVTSDTDIQDLRIMHKKDWKRLRNKYLNLQREKAADIKRQLWNSANRTPSARPRNKFPIKTSRNMNFYGANQEQNDEKEMPAVDKHKLALEKHPLFEYKPGIIVQVKFPQPCVDVKDFKSDMRQYAQVKYVDVKEGSQEAFIRCDESENAQKFVQQTTCVEYSCQIISGETESEYWKKIMKDREMKMTKAVKIPTKRGREKITKVLANHIRFEDDE